MKFRKGDRVKLLLDITIPVGGPAMKTGDRGTVKVHHRDHAVHVNFDKHGVFAVWDTDLKALRRTK